MTFTAQFLLEAQQVLLLLDVDAIERMAQVLADVRASRGRLFILGNGGGAGHAAHAVNDFRKIAGIEAYAPTDNASELTARANDDGWECTFTDWLRVSRLDANDAVLVFSVGGGEVDTNISPNIVQALKRAVRVGAHILGVVGRDGGYTAQTAEVCVVIPTVNAAHITPMTETMQALIWHLLVTHPLLRESRAA